MKEIAGAICFEALDVDFSVVTAASEI